MVWWGVSYQGVTDLHFCAKGVKTTAKNYQEDILEQIVKPLNTKMFNGEHWIFQQDSAPAHKAKSTQQWLETNVPEFIKANEWPSESPDLNPLDYSLWAYLEEKVCSKRYHNLDQLKSALVRAMKEIPLEKVRVTIDQCPELDPLIPPEEERNQKCFACDGIQIIGPHTIQDIKKVTTSM
ncbi:hypothetical protein LAZ67_22000800 [Cordylochernes scorpioides]|uniref:Tc1-like transposase DDE domain-containing protein n=1 Tax=Cordylochernes scorpioides TaxID=51811 RepID=A0ABY6LSF6_9ARAC|nr:hypothetical protein LAZ67_22000800 [Cordylochernes scorpioides]